MAVNLQKGQKVNLRKEDGSSFHHLMVGLGWDPAEQKKSSGFFSALLGGDDIDCDASVFLCKGGRVVDSKDVVYFGNKKHKSGAVNHMGDNLTGEGEGDDEQIMVNLDGVPAEYDKLVFVVNIYRAQQRKQHFGMIKNAFIRIVDQDTNREFCRYNLSENYDGMLSLICGEIYRYKGEWKFNALGQATKDNSVSDLVEHYR